MGDLLTRLEKTLGIRYRVERELGRGVAPPGLPYYSAWQLLEHMRAGGAGEGRSGLPCELME